MYEDGHKSYDQEIHQEYLILVRVHDTPIPCHTIITMCKLKHSYKHN